MLLPQHREGGTWTAWRWIAHRGLPGLAHHPDGGGSRDRRCDRGGCGRARRRTGISERRAGGTAAACDPHAGGLRHLPHRCRWAGRAYAAVPAAPDRRAGQPAPCGTLWAARSSWRAWEEIDAALHGRAPHEVAWGTTRFAFLRDNPEEARIFDTFMAHFPDDRHQTLADA